MKLTETELGIMEILWTTATPMSQGDIISHAENYPWKKNSIKVLLGHLLRKGMIQAVGMVRSGKVYARTFVPVYSREEYFAKEVTSHIDNISGLFSALLKQSDVSEQVLHELEQLIEQKKREREKK